MALNGVGVAANVGQAVPLAFLISAILVFLVAFGIMRLAGHYSHAGSVYAFTGATLGPRAGLLLRLGAARHLSLVHRRARLPRSACSSAQFANGTGIWSGSEWIWIALVAAICVGILAYSDIRITTRTLLSIEAVSVLLITVLMVVIFVKIASGSAPRDQGFNADVFRLPGGTSSSALGLGVVLAFLSWGGFEGAAALGEETNEPRRQIPRAIRNAVIGAGIFYVVCMLAQSWGFGTDKSGVAAFASSSSPLGDLGKSYIGSWMGDLINLGAGVSASRARSARPPARRGSCSPWAATDS